MKNWQLIYHFIIYHLLFNSIGYENHLSDQLINKSTQNPKTLKHPNSETQYANQRSTTEER